MSKLLQLALNDEGFVFDPSSGDSYVLNETGLFIVRALRDGKAHAEVVEAVAAAYEVESAEAERDVSDLTERLQTFGLL